MAGAWKSREASSSRRAVADGKVAAHSLQAGTSRTRSLGRLRFRLGEVAVGDELGEQAAGCLQLPEGAAFDDAALVEHEDQIGIGHG